MLFRVRGVNAVRDDRPKNQMTIADILAFRDTWRDPPHPGFSVAAILHRVYAERQKKAEVPKLVMSENGFRVRSKEQMAESERELRRVQSTLNKLTEQNFDAVAQEMLSHELIFDPTVLSGAVNIIFTKAVAEPVFSGLYARLCARIANYEKELISEAAEDPESELGRRVSVAREHLAQLTPDERARYGNMGDFVRVALILRCQAFHEQFVQQDHPSDEEAEERLRKQNMANIKFVGELYMKQLVTNKVLLIICSTALVLGFVGGAVKTSVTDVDVEMVISLMNVLGKRFDDTTPSPMREEIWDALKRCMDDRRFSMRIRFLLQNLFDWRNSGWKPRESASGTTTTTTTESGSGGTTSSTTSTAGTAPHRLPSSGSSASLQWPPEGGRHGNTPLTSSASGGHYRRSVGGMGSGSRVASYNDLGGVGSSSGGFAGQHTATLLPPPPPFPHASATAGQPLPPPPPFPHALQQQQQQQRFPAPHYTVAPPPPPPPPQQQQQHDHDDDAHDEVAQLLVQAQPPRSLTSDVEARLLSAMRDADVDGDWATADALVQSALPAATTSSSSGGGAAETAAATMSATALRRACAVYALCKCAVLTNVVGDRDVFTRALHRSGLFDDAATLTCGFAWCLVHVVVHGLREDCPLVYTRFASIVAASRALRLSHVLCDVLVRTANCLDALCTRKRQQRADHNGGDDDDDDDADDWEVAFVDACASVVSQWAQTRVRAADTKKSSDSGSSSQHEEAALLDALAAVRQRPFMRDAAPDVLMELVQQGCLHETAIAAWLATHADTQRESALVEQLEQLFPGLGHSAHA